MISDNDTIAESGVAFSAAGICHAQPNLYSSIMLWNPYGSGKTLYVDKIFGTCDDSSTPSGLDVRMTRLPLPELSVQRGWNKNPAMPFSVAEVRYLHGTAADVVSVGTGILSVQQSVEFWYDDTSNPYDFGGVPQMVPQGWGLSCNQTPVGSTLNVTFAFREKAADVVVGPTVPSLTERLLCHFTTDIADTHSHTTAAAGNAVVDSTGLKLDGAGDKVIITSASDLVLGTSDFAVEFSVWPNGSQALKGILGNRISNDTSWLVRLSTVSNQVQIVTGIGAVVTGPALVSGQWNTVRWVRTAGVSSLTVNGVSASAADTKNYSDTGNIWVGMDPLADVGDFNGWIKELKISRA